MVRYLLLYFCLFAFAVTGQAQSGNGYLIQHFTTENGLPSNGIKGVQWDEQSGFLWIATEAGIARYNGIDFAYFTRENSKPLVQERMFYLVKNRDGEILGADIGNNLFTVHGNRILQYFLGQPDKRTENKKRLILSTAGTALKNKLELFLNTRAGAPVGGICQLSANELVYWHDRRKFSQIQSNGTVTDFELPFETIHSFSIEGHFFVVDRTNKFYFINPSGQQPKALSVLTENGVPVPLNATNFLLYWENGMECPILFSGNNAWLIRYQNQQLVATAICSAVPTFSFIRFAQYSEKFNTLFIGTDSKGIIIIRKNKVRVLKNPATDIRERNAYYSQIELNKENILTNEGHVIGLNRTEAGPLPLSGKFDFSVYKTGDTALWYVQYNKKFKKSILHEYQYKSGFTRTYPKITVLSNFGLYANGQQFFLATQEGLGQLRGDSLDLLFPAPDPGRNMLPYALTEFSPGVMGLASCQGVILYHLKSKKTDTLLQSEGNCYRSLWKYKDYVFIGSYGKGFYIWKDGRLKQMPLDKNKFLLYAHCFMPDKTGYCWISTNRGLFKVKLDDLLQAWQNGQQPVYYHYFGFHDGLESTELNGGCAPCALEMKSGLFSFPTMDGLLWVDPQNTRPSLPEGLIFIDEFRTGNKLIDPDSLQQKAISFADREIVIKTGFSAWCNRENIYLDYKINQDKEWTPVDMSNGAILRLHNLPAGSYRLQIRKMNGFGDNNYSYQELRFRIKTPWSQSWWFYLLCVFVLFGLITLYLRFRTRRYQLRQRTLEKQVAEKTSALLEQNTMLEKNNQIKTRLISIISHDIVTPLKFLTGSAKNLMEKKEQLSGEMQNETIAEIANTSQELQLLSTNILNWIKYQNENRRLAKETFLLHNLVEQVFGVLRSLARQKNLQIINEVNPSLQIHQFYEPVKILIYNLLTNAIRFTEKGKVVVHAGADNKAVIISVTDEGSGMSAEQVQRLLEDDIVITAADVDKKRGHGLGFLIIKDLLKTIGGSLQIESKKDKGTVVKVEIPDYKL